MANGKSSRSGLRSRGVQALIVLVVAAVVVGAFFMTRKPAITYFTAPVSTGNITSVVQATGTINPIHTVSVGAQISGIITHIYVDFNSPVVGPVLDKDGNVVKNGTLMATIDPRVYQNALDSAQGDLQNSIATVQSAQANVEVDQANVNSAIANVVKSKASVDQMKAQMDRSVPLYQQGIESAQQRDVDVANYQTAQATLDASVAAQKQAEAQLASAKAAVVQAQAVVLEKKAEVQTAETNLGYCNIYAPVSGTVIDRAVDQGQTVASSLSTPTLFSVATDLNTMWVYIQTDESDVGRLKDGYPGTFTVDAYPTQIFHGTIYQKREFATTVQNVVEYDTILTFQNPNQELFPGMTAYVQVPSAHAYNVLRVPNSALRFKPDYTPAQLRAVLAQYHMDQPAAAANGRRGGGGGGRRGGGGGGGGARPSGSEAGAANAADTTLVPQTAVIWKLDPADKQTLIPVRVRAGITDFTNTAVTVLQGSLQNGDEVVTGEIAPKSSSASPLGGAPPTGGRGPGR